ncbi:carbonic anhydrase [gamma proteobacterium HdN1]|nr:carbonic anhydrase [gamma proteobacterium HdN1]
MPQIKQLLANNQKWVDSINAEDPEFFQRLARQQYPEYLWIGCSDSRVPANQIIGLAPGEVFVHRNVANLVIQTDFNCMSVIEYAVAVLKVRHVIICGHYGCGGVTAAMENSELGLIGNWLHTIKDTYSRYQKSINALETKEERINRLCELNVAVQVRNVASSHVVQKAWHQGQALRVHGWVYGLKDGIIKDLKISRSSIDDLEDEYKILPDA